jgi:TPR repeat protein
MDTSYFENSRENTEKVIEVRKKLLAKTVTSNDIAILLAVADTGDCPLAEFLYGACLYFGEGVSADMPKAFAYFDKCHSHGSGDLQMKMARIYLSAGTVYMDRAVKCVEAAADDFDPIAMRTSDEPRKEGPSSFALKTFSGLDEKIHCRFSG